MKKTKEKNSDINDEVDKVYNMTIGELRKRKHKLVSFNNEKGDTIKLLLDITKFIFTIIISFITISTTIYIGLHKIDSSYERLSDQMIEIVEFENTQDKDMLIEKKKEILEGNKEYLLSGIENFIGFYKTISKIIIFSIVIIMICIFYFASIIKRIAYNKTIISLIEDELEYRFK